MKIARALQQHVAHGPDELSFHKGQLIELMSHRGDTWRGRIAESEGKFPAELVEIVATERKFVALRLLRVCARVSLRTSVVALL
jgi:hypothetical protein